MEQLTVKILGREYRLVVCSQTRKKHCSLQWPTSMRKMSAIRDHGKITGNDRIAVFAALNIANELLTSRAPQGALSDLALGEFRGRIDSMSAVLDAALTPQEKLF